MKKLLFYFLLALLSACSTREPGKNLVKPAAVINETTIKALIDTVKTAQPASDVRLLEKGIKHAASLWRQDDGTPEVFSEFVKKNYISDHSKRKMIFEKISGYLESIYGFNNEITLDLRKTLDEARGEIDEIDRIFGNYAIESHLQNDFYSNKIAFVIALNYPYFTLAEKEELGPKWSRDEWAMARLGDLFISRVPSELEQAVNEATGNSEMYIAEYNIYGASSY